MMRFSVSAISVACLLAYAPLALAEVAQQPARTSTAATADAAKLKQLADAYYTAVASNNPLLATFTGDARYNDKLGLAISPVQRARHDAAMRALQKRLALVDRAKLGTSDQTSYDILAYELKREIAAGAFPNHLLPVDQMMFTTPLLLASLANGQSSQPISTPQEYRVFLARLKELTPWLDQAVVNMRAGIKAGIVLPKALVIAAIPQYRKLASPTLEANLFYAPIVNLPSGFSEADKRALTAQYRQEIEKRLTPAAQRLADFLEKDYLPAARTSAGWGALPNGKAWYEAKAAESTTTTLSPDEIHEIGLREVARIQAEFAVVGPKMGYTGAPAGLAKWAGAQEKYRPFKTADEILEVYRKLNAEVEPKLAALFTLRPKAPLEQRLEPELTRATASDHYSPPSLDGKRPGIFWSVVNDPTQYQSTKMTTLLLHEGSPGHHFQLALQQELSLPDFRKFALQSAFAEGWALYAESLGKEMGLYDKPDQYFGHLNDELLRAARLVVDTGLHAKGWTREQAISYLMETNGYTEAVATNAVERYMAWPGQALAYKIGGLKIAELRREAQQALGAKFSLPAFHAVILGGGSRPLAVVDTDVKRWIAQTR
ncbi:DUF885 family protein [Massilia sp. 9I]|uniref:DUF885 domain-containing protein n=1 Tax=Massilia sp. 9I TaxID=2653152 RepID=UPI0012F30A3C|nr:DUF885 domain-containing protein [Massilia sp. 9I]VXB77388.1 conserved exported hypothetical protein [Massilia sp. 9I]